MQNELNCYNIQNQAGLAYIGAELRINRGLSGTDRRKSAEYSAMHTRYDCRERRTYKDDGGSTQTILRE